MKMLGYVLAVVFLSSSAVANSNHYPAERLAETGEKKEKDVPKKARNNRPESGKEDKNPPKAPRKKKKDNRPIW